MASIGSSRGYPVNFAKQPPEEIPTECPICFHVLYRPKMVSCCGHSFCGACIGRVASTHKPCPLCGQKFTVADNKWLERTLNDYKVHCTHQEKGCKWTGELGQLKHHLNQNPLPDKLLEGCQFQDIPCALCRSYRCEQWLMADHVLNDCPNRDIECEYSSVGCDVKKPQQQLAVHMREAASIHLSLFKTFTQNSLSEKDNEIDDLKQELREQREQSDMKLREMQKQIQKIERKQSHAGRYWTLSIIVLIGAICIAYLYPATSSELVATIIKATDSHSSRIEEIDNWIKNELSETMSSLLSEFQKTSCDHKSTEKELRESIISLSSEVERIGHSTELRESLLSEVENVRRDLHLTEKELKQAMQNLSSMVEKINGSQCLIEKRLREGMNNFSSELKRVSLSQQIMVKGLNESSIQAAKFSDELCDTVAQMQNAIHQLQSNADTASEVSRYIGLLKANVGSIEMQMATNSEASKMQADAIKCLLKLTQNFVVDELSTCGCVDSDFVTPSFLNGACVKTTNLRNEYLARQKRLRNRLAISLKDTICRCSSWK